MDESCLFGEGGGGGNISNEWRRTDISQRRCFVLSELRSRPGLPALMSLMVFVDVKQH